MNSDRIKAIKALSIVQLVLITIAVSLVVQLFQLHASLSDIPRKAGLILVENNHGVLTPRGSTFSASALDVWCTAPISNENNGVALSVEGSWARQLLYGNSNKDWQIWAEFRTGARGTDAQVSQHLYESGVSDHDPYFQALEELISPTATEGDTEKAAIEFVLVLRNESGSRTRSLGKFVATKYLGSDAALERPNTWYFHETTFTPRELAHGHQLSYFQDLQVSVGELDLNAPDLELPESGILNDEDRRQFVNYTNSCINSAISRESQLPDVEVPFVGVMTSPYRALLLLSLISIGCGASFAHHLSRVQFNESDRCPWLLAEIAPHNARILRQPSAFVILLVSTTVYFCASQTPLALSLLLLSEVSFVAYASFHPGWVSIATAVGLLLLSLPISILAFKHVKRVRQVGG